MDVIVGSGKGSTKKKRLLIILGVVAVLVLAGAAGLGVRWLQDRDSTDESTQSSGLGQDIDDIQSLRAAGDLNGSDNRINEALENSGVTDEQRYMLYIQQGNNMVDRGDYNGAIDAYLKAEQSSQTYEIAVLLADTYKQADNKEKAIEYYKKAITLIPESPLRDEDKAMFEQNIINLGGQP